MRRQRCRWLLAILIFSCALTAQPDDLLTRILTGMRQSQQVVTTRCGNVTETRTSPLIAKPMVLHGRFCVEGTNRFTLEYVEPTPMQIRLHGSTLKITSGNEKTDVLDIGNGMRRAQSTFGGENALENLKKDFTITTEENSRDYEMKLVPRSMHFRHRLNELIVKLDKRDFFPRSLEVSGKSGVKSEFVFEVTSVNGKFPEEKFEGHETK